MGSISGVDRKRKDNGKNSNKQVFYLSLFQIYSYFYVSVIRNIEGVPNDYSRSVLFDIHLEFLKNCKIP